MTDADRRAEELMAKLDADQPLDAADVQFALAYLDPSRDEDGLADYQQEIDEAITADLGHEVYRTILREFEAAGVIDELRRDLVDPSLDPEGFEKVELDDRDYYRTIRVGEAASESVGSIYPPEKRPTRLWRIGGSLLDYLFCTGRGFTSTRR
ncbi:hypothetical protein BRC81_11130 [Halobacteriales archaeon QS_1_68_20]|nr:MAG: hypothetical protein BRC81_11130 [Halobacteriales archaeon QS_1_68_20]